ncbi:SWIM zinc finger family protein [Glycomyces buryatensis]|uniref:SWIM-type domain-containing protein n=1 Tax=Glycomyces buryatensis TaxID=2570927 RepID=A0A4S8QH16_9ACTN|nr:SWIM zinc finger family protein [Glycomyces buryatensis]THV43021.1 hypothetical protein FAB82_03440 [Glycomyces buryatensis]
MKSGFTLDDLAELAGPKSYEHGLKYFDAVRHLTASDKEIRAEVQGTERYRVSLRLKRNGIEGRCDCPWGEDENFCKHCVAVGVVYLYEHEHGGDVHEPVDLRSHLASLERSALVELLLEAAEDDSALRERLERRAAFADTAKGRTIDGQLSAVDNALVLNGHYQLDYNEHEHYAAAVSDFAAHVRALVVEGRPGDAVALARHAIDRVREYWERAEVEYRVGEAAGELASAHLDACTAAEIDPIATAEWIAAHQLDDNTMPELDIEDYATVLGDEGLAHYGSILRTRKGHIESWTHRYLLIRYAECVGDDEFILEAHAQTASEDGNAWPLVDQLDRMGRRAEAVERAREALASGRQDQRLIDFLSEHYESAEDRAALIALHKDRFEQDPGLHSYEALARLEEPELLGWAVESVQDLLKGPRPRWGLADDLADMLLRQDRVAEAWQAAREHRALPETRVKVAKRHRFEAPEATGELFMAQAEALIDRMNKQSYEAAAELIALAAECLDRSTGPGAGALYVANLREAHYRKRNLMTALDARVLT